MKLDVLVAATPARTVTGQVLHVADPISFWGGVSPRDGRLCDPRSALCGQVVTGRVLILRELRGSSSASSVLLELIYKQIAPAAIILSVPDAILALGALVAVEMQWPTPGIFQLGAAEQKAIPDGAGMSITAGGAAQVERGRSRDR